MKNSRRTDTSNPFELGIKLAWFAISFLYFQMYNRADRIWIRAVLYPLTIYHIPFISSPISYLLNTKLLWDMKKVAIHAIMPTVFGFNFTTTINLLLNVSFTAALLVIPIVDYIMVRKDSKWQIDRSNHARLSIFIFFIVVSLLSLPANISLSSGLLFKNMSLLQKISLHSYSIVGCLAFCNLISSGSITFFLKRLMLSK